MRVNKQAGAAIYESALVYGGRIFPEEGTATLTDCAARARIACTDPLNLVKIHNLMRHYALLKCNVAGREGGEVATFFFPPILFHNLESHN